MKIAIASDIYYPMTNGVAVFAHNLANGLAKAGHEVMVICPSFKKGGKAYREIDKDSGVVTMHLKSMRFHLYPDQINKVPEKRKLLGLPMPRLVYKHGIWFPLKPYDELEEILNEFQPDVIHLQTAETIALATIKYVKRYDVPLVSTGHAYPDNITSQFKVLKPVKRPVDAIVRAYMASFLKHAEYATMPTEMAIGDLVPKNRKRFKVPVEALSNGVDLKCFRNGKPDTKILKKYKIKPGAKRVL
ncbi:glycosyltransferase, partial [Candidatus Saccharibacteria bacterium]|nr:glycosyltransferase [Candidatus Saccharibacteria bacterium]